MTDEQTKEMLESTLGPEIDKMAQEVLEETQVQEPQEGTFIAQQMDWYEFDFEKINTIEDIKVILQAMGMKFNEMAPNFDKLKEYGKKVS